MKDIELTPINREETEPDCPDTVAENDILIPRTDSDDLKAADISVVSIISTSGEPKSSDSSSPVMKLNGKDRSLPNLTEQADEDKSLMNNKRRRFASERCNSNIRPHPS